eukprot:scaffold3836_cov125-Isochrysis_galbana.AAC.17
MPMPMPTLTRPHPHDIPTRPSHTTNRGPAGGPNVPHCYCYAYVYVYLVPCPYTFSLLVEVWSTL